MENTFLNYVKKMKQPKSATLCLGILLVLPNCGSNVSSAIEEIDNENQSLIHVDAKKDGFSEVTFKLNVDPSISNFYSANISLSNSTGLIASSSDPVTENLSIIFPTIDYGVYQLDAELVDENGAIVSTDSTQLFVNTPTVNASISLSYQGTSSSYEIIIANSDVSVAIEINDAPVIEVDTTLINQSISVNSIDFDFLDGAITVSDAEDGELCSDVTALTFWQTCEDINGNVLYIADNNIYESQYNYCNFELKLYESLDQINLPSYDPNATFSGLSLLFIDDLTSCTLFIEATDQNNITSYAEIDLPIPANATTLMGAVN